MLTKLTSVLCQWTVFVSRHQGTKGRFLPGFHSCDVKLFLRTWPGRAAKGDTRALSLVEKKTHFTAESLGEARKGCVSWALLLG